MAALKALSTELINIRFKFTVIEGAKIDSDLMYMDEFQIYNKDITQFHYCTDDGSYGEKGFTSDIFEKIINEINNLIHKNKVIKKVKIYPRRSTSSGGTFRFRF